MTEDELETMADEEFSRVEQIPKIAELSLDDALIFWGCFQSRATSMCMGLDDDISERDG